jgi:hypothetical protein
MSGKPGDGGNLGNEGTDGVPPRDGGQVLRTPHPIAGEARRRYTNFINVCGCWTGHLFSQIASVAMDEAQLMAAVR